MKLPLTIIIPARKEEKTILKTLEELSKQVKTPHRIIVVNDLDKSDKTDKIVKKYCQKHKNVSLIINKKQGFAAALRLGFKAIKKGVVVPVMADRCDQLETIDKMFQKIKEGGDIVCGSRYMKGGRKKGGPKIQSFFSRLVGLTLHWLTGIPTKDVSNAFKMYRKEVLDKVKINLDSGVEVSMDITLQAYFQGARITEIPTSWTGRTLGQSKFKMLQRAPRYFKIYLWALIKSLAEFFNRFYPLSLFILLAMVVVTALGQTVNLYFWTDDWDLFLKVQHPELGLWGMEPGPFGSGPYRYLHTPFLFLYPFFGLNAGAYFAVGILIYYLAAVLVYLLIFEISSQKSVAIAAAVIYASLGYIGSYTIFHLSNSYQNVGAVVFIILTAWLLARHYKRNKYLYYFLSVISFYATVEIEHLRSHGAIFVVLALSLLFAKWKKNLKNILLNTVKLAPFIIIYCKMYKVAYTSSGGSTVGGFFQRLIKGEVSGYFVNPFGTFSNIMIPDTITKTVYGFLQKRIPQISAEFLLLPLFILITLWIVQKIKKKTRWSYWTLILIEIAFFFFNRWAFSQPILLGQTGLLSFTAMLGCTLLLFCFLIVLFVWDDNNNKARLILFGIALIFGQYIGYLVAAPQWSFLSTTDRYLTPSTVGTALVLGVLFSMIRFKKVNLYSFLVAFYSIYLIILMNLTINNVVHQISNPTKKFWQTIKKELAVLPRDSITLFDFENDPNLKYQINSSFPSTALAIFYGLDNRAALVGSFDELFSLLSERKTSIDKIFSFYISNRGVINTSDTVRQLLLKPSTETKLDLSKWTLTTPQSQTLTVIRQEGGAGANPTFEGIVDYRSMVSMLATFKMSVLPLEIESLKFPYYDLTKMIKDSVSESDLKTFPLDRGAPSEETCKNRLLYLKTERQHLEFLKRAKVTASSEWEGGEASNLIDNQVGTDWHANHGHWQKKHEEIVIDLGKIQLARRLIWINYLARTTPTVYSIKESVDGLVWTEVKKIESRFGRNSQEVIVEELPGNNVRYLKMIIEDAVKEGAPSLAEIWVDDISETADYQSWQEVVECPFCCPVGSKEQEREIKSLLQGNLKARLWWTTNSRVNFHPDNSQEFLIIPDGKIHTYKILLPAGGTILQQLRISNFQVPVRVELKEFSIRSLSLEELEDIHFE